MKKVILFGEPMALLIADTAGDLKNVEHFTRSLSGAEVNVSIGLSRLGHKAEYLTRLGDDPFGHYIKESLEKNNIGTDLISFDEIYRTGIQLKNRVTDGSDPFAPYYRKGSAASHISPNEIEKIDFTDVDLVHVTGIPPALSETARAATFKLMEKAKENSIPITFDPNLRPALWEDKETMVKVINELATFADVILPGVEECETLVGTRDMDKISDFYKNIGVKTIIIKDGKNGAFVNDGDSSFRVDGFNVEKVVDTVGAGDGFAVGVISGIL
ncbi:MAG: sugar kinase, partial [Lachnospiraceae bacterium]|nr:sugar kinase [Lachnospiraceae bacterium]